MLWHFIFWVVYLLQDALLHFSWMGPTLAVFPDNEQFWMAVQAALVVAIPKVLLTYYFLYIGIQKVLSDKRKPILLAIEITVLVAASIVLFRVLYSFYVLPTIYRGLVAPSPLLSARSVLLTLAEIGFVVGLAITIKLLRTQIHGKEREKNLVRDKLETELKFLRNQTNPHFLFNTLNNIYALARKKSDDTAEVVMRLSKLLRFMLYEAGKGPIPVADEIKLLEDYLELEKIRYNNRLAVKFTKQIDNGSQVIQPLLLLPFVENAFKHGVSESRFDSFVNIDMRLTGGRLEFEIENTTENGYQEKVQDNIGLSNVRRQLELMYKEYDMQVHNHDHIFKVNLIINLNSNGKV
jgi:two-component system LytT family sensor kinase